jgi:hypothetical protein
MKESDIADAVQPVLQCRKGRALRQEHENAVKAFVEVRIFFGLEKLKAKI